MDDMIVAIALAPQSGVDDETVIEGVTATLLRGPFGGTLVAAHPAAMADLEDALAGFAVQYVQIAPNGNPTPQAILAAALKSADAFRARWEKAMAAAAGRFEKTPSDPGDILPTKDAAEWAKLKHNPDVKIRGLARSFDRDGVLVVPADYSDLKKEHLAQMVEAFARDGQQPAPKPFAQAVMNGMRGWPVIMTVEGAREVAALPAATVLPDWLLQNVERVSDVKLSV